MNEVFSFGSYFPGEGVLYRLDPRTKLLCGLSFLIIALLARNFAALGVMALFVAALYALSGVPVGRALRSLAPLLAIVVVVSVLNLFINQDGAVVFQFGIIRITEDGVHSFAFMGARMLLMMCAMSLVTMTTMTLDLTHAVERLLGPFARFGLPSHELGMMLGIALRFMPQFASELVTIRRAQVSRGAAASGGPVKSMRMLISLLVPLFASAFRHAETLSAAMDARCYHGKEGRTRLHPLHFAARDGIATAAIALLFAGIFAANILL